MKGFLAALFVALTALSAPSHTFAQDKREQEIQISGGMKPGRAYVGERIDLDVQGADIHSVLRLLAEVADLNIISSDKVKCKVTIRLKNVRWDQALDVIVSTCGLGMVVYGMDDS